jgi:ABC-type polysaccharide/polyol phosphate transport system ATPase subunit
MTAVQFINVSKQYRLGVTRVSLPSMITDRIKRLRSPDIEHAAQAQRLWALRDVSFDLPPGECLALIGPNGAGKTTILRLLSNISKPSKGTVVTRGRMSALLELGAGFHPDLTGRENIYLNAAILGLRKQYVNRRFDES